MCVPQTWSVTEVMASKPEEIRIRTWVVVGLRHGRKSHLWITSLIHTL